MIYLLKLVNLPERVYRLYPHEMSGGMLQRVAIAISLLHKPKLIIFDEATTALDVVTQGQILQEVVQMEKEMDMTRIMITHDMSVVAASCNKVAVMYAGEFMEIGRVEYIFKNPMHPYTQGLLNSFPSLKGENERLRCYSGISSGSFQETRRLHLCASLSESDGAVFPQKASGFLYGGWQDGFLLALRKRRCERWRIENLSRLKM